MFAGISLLLLPFVCAGGPVAPQSSPQPAPVVIAILRPDNHTVQTEGTDLHTTNSLETADRVLDRFGSEALSWPGWKDVGFVSHDQCIQAQDEEFGDGSPVTPILKMVKLGRLAEHVRARYVVTFTVNELAAYHSAGLLQRRHAGRTNLTVSVYDSATRKFVWRDTESETSIHAQLIVGESDEHYLDQSMLNCLRTCLEPFVRGERKLVPPPAKWLAKITTALDDKSVLIDIGEPAGVCPGDIFTSFDSRVRLKVAEVFQNGSSAVLLEGGPTVGLAFKPED